MADPLLCVVCQQVEPREGVVCDRDRQRIAAALWELRDLHALLPYALTPGRGEPVRAGTRVEAGLPLREAALDLAGRAPANAGLDSVQDYRGDQDGAVPVAAVLDGWARDWSSLRGDEELPEPTVVALVSWMSRRLVWALDNHPAIDDFASELTVTLYQVRSVIQVSRRPIYSDEACPACGTAALRRQPGDARWRCGDCREETTVTHPEDCLCGCERTN